MKSKIDFDPNPVNYNWKHARQHMENASTSLVGNFPIECDNKHIIVSNDFQQSNEKRFQILFAFYDYSGQENKDLEVT